MLPGPKEPDADQLQEYLRLVVDDLIKLYEHGIRVPTPSSPQGAQNFVASLRLPDISRYQGVLCE
jgi:hypothetical protein